MRVLLVGITSGGEGTFIRNLVSYPPPGVKYSCLFPDKVVEDVVVYKKLEKTLNTFRSRIIGAGMRIRVIKLTNNTYSLIHIHGIATKLLTMSKLPIIFSASGNMWQAFLDFYNWSKPKFYKSYFGSKLLYRIFDITDRIHNNEALNKLVTWSEFVKKSYIRHGVPEEKVEVIYPGFPEPEHIVCQKTDNINFLFIAGKGKFQRKGGFLVLKAFKHLLNEYSNINLFLVGDKPNLSLNNNIRYFGFVDLKVLYDSIYPNTNVLVLPTYADGFPTACAEVQGYGIPAITTKIWANPEIVVDGKTGFLITPNDLKSLVKYMSYLIEDNKLREKMSRAAKQNFERKFSIKVMKERYGELYKSVV